MKVELMNAFVNAAVNALETMAMITATRGQVYIKTDQTAEFARDISAVIGLAGELNGWVAVCFQRGVAMQVAANMLSEEKSELDADVCDAVGEVVNMVAGGAKGELAQNGLPFKIAIPTVIVGAAHQLSRVRDFPYFVIPFTTAHGMFTLEVCLKMNMSEPAAAAEQERGSVGV